MSTRRFRCVKCESALVGVKYREARKKSTQSEIAFVAANMDKHAELRICLEDEPEHLALTCERCGYAWTENTSDAKEDK